MISCHVIPWQLRIINCIAVSWCKISFFLLIQGWSSKLLQFECVDFLPLPGVISACHNLIQVNPIYNTVFSQIRWITIIIRNLVISFLNFHIIVVYSICSCKGKIIIQVIIESYVDGSYLSFVISYDDPI